MADARRMCPILAMSRGTDSAYCQRDRCQWWVTMENDQGGCAVQVASVWFMDLMTAGHRTSDGPKPDPST